MYFRMWDWFYWPFHGERLIDSVYAGRRPAHDNFYLSAHSKIFAPTIQSDNDLKLVLQTSLIGAAHPSYATLFPQVLNQRNFHLFLFMNYFPDKITSLVLLFLWILCDPPTWQFLVVFFVESNLGNYIYTVVVF